jgi:hypothetical protein
MRRRTFFRLLALVPGLRAWAQTAAFPGEHADTLRAIAKLVLPTEIDSARIADAFTIWVRDYRPGAEMEHGYGNTRLRVKPPSPAPGYWKQLAALRDATRDSIESALTEAKITDLPRTPDGRHVVTDLMAFYFRSSDANDLCYRSRIGRDQCRGLAGSERPPAPLPGNA